MAYGCGEEPRESRRFLRTGAAVAVRRLDNQQASGLEHARRQGHDSLRVWQVLDQVPERDDVERLVGESIFGDRPHGHVETLAVRDARRVR